MQKFQNMKKYYWILIDTLAKTLEIVESASCQAATEEQIAKSKFNIDKMNGLQRTQFNNRFRMIFNDTSDKIDLNNVYKYARKYTII